MTAEGWIWIAGYPPAVIAIATFGEWERRTSTDPAERAAVLRPALDGVLVATLWPLLLAAGVGLACLWLLHYVPRAFLHHRDVRPP